jgi:hypothetical protein
MNMLDNKVTSGTFYFTVVSKDGDDYIPAYVYVDITSKSFPKENGIKIPDEILDILYEDVVYFDWCQYIVPSNINDIFKKYTVMYKDAVVKTSEELIRLMHQPDSYDQT